jgi:hypothetical protein
MAAMLAWCSGCSDLHNTTNELDDLQRAQNYWGRISASSPHWIESTNQFKVNFNEDPTNYASAARSNVVAGQASSLESSLFVGQALQGTFAPPISTGSPAATGGTNAPSIPQIPNQAQAALANFAPLLSLGGQAPVPDERQVVSKAINDKIAEQLLELMANPTVDSNQQRVLFGVIQVTCQPGQRTRQGFMADLSITLRYGRDIDGWNIDQTSQYSPDVLGVLPLIDSENVQLLRSDRSQVELAAALSAAFTAKGMNAAANLLSDYVKRQQSDVDTRNTLPIATTYSTGSTFGFQVYPSLQAIENPGKGDSKAGNILQPITFPAVVAIGVDKMDLEHLAEAKAAAVDATKVEADAIALMAAAAGAADIASSEVNAAKDTATNAARNVGSITPRFSTNSWNLIVANTRIRWIPLKRPFWYPMLGHFPRYEGWLPSHSSLHEDIWQAKELDKAKMTLDKLRNSDNRDDFDHQFAALQTAYEALDDTSAFVTTSSYFPEDLFKPANANASTISDVFPHSVWRNNSTTFAILGTNLTGSSSVTIAGIPCANVTSMDVTSKGADGKPSKSQIIYATLPAPNPFCFMTNATNNIDFVVSGPSGRATKTLPLALQGEVASDAIVTITRDTNTSKVTAIDIKRGEELSEGQLLKALEKILEKSEPPPKTIITKP